MLVVRDGKAVLEARGLLPVDWNDEFSYRQDVANAKAGVASSSSSSSSSSSDGSATRVDSEPHVIVPAVSVLSKEERHAAAKQRNSNARRLGKIETALGKYESKLGALDAEMLVYGADRGKLMELHKEKESLELKIAALYQEMEELMDFV